MSFINYKIALKDTVEEFTKKLFYTLFDEDFYEQNKDRVKELFLEISIALQIENREGLWEVYQGTFKEIRQKLDLDAILLLDKQKHLTSLFLPISRN